MTTKIERRVKIKYRVRNKISGTAEQRAHAVVTEPFPHLSYEE